MSSRKNLFWIIWGVVNCVFIMKYSPLPIAVSVVGAAGLTGVLWGIDYKRDLFRKSETPLTVLWWIGVAGATLLHLLLLAKVERMDIGVDRWSAIQYFWDAFLRGEFPYAVQTHVMNGNTPSPLPVWQLLLFPFYLMRDVGLLQPAVFIGIAAVLYRKIPGAFDRLLLLSALILAPGYWYESLVRSDLVSSMIVGIAALWLIYRLGSSESIRKNVAAAILLGLLMSTRAVLAIPAALVVAGVSQKRIGKFFGLSLGAFPVFLLTLLPFYLWDSELFMKYNPLVLHANKSIPGLVPTALVIALVMGFRLKKFGAYMITAGVLIFILTTLSSLAIIWGTPLNEIFEHGSFDVSYLLLGLPFLYVGMAEEKVKSLENV